MTDQSQSIPENFIIRNILKCVYSVTYNLTSNQTNHLNLSFYNQNKSGNTSKHFLEMFTIIKYYMLFYLYINLLN